MFWSHPETNPPYMSFQSEGTPEHLHLCVIPTGVLFLCHPERSLRSRRACPEYSRRDPGFRPREVATPFPKKPTRILKSFVIPERSEESRIFLDTNKTNNESTRRPLPPSDCSPSHMGRGQGLGCPERAKGTPDHFHLCVIPTGVCGVEEP
jgi:hypothetical protein